MERLSCVVATDVRMSPLDIGMGKRLLLHICESRGFSAPRETIVKSSEVSAVDGRGHSAH